MFKKPSINLGKSTIKYVPLENDSFLDIAEARNFLQSNIYQYCHTEKITPFVWLLDEDLIIDERANNYLLSLPKFKIKGIDVAIGSIERDSPNSAFAGMQTQLFDLIENIKFLNRLDEKSILPNREKLNQQLRYKYPDYYYDFSSKHNEHLSKNFWIIPDFIDETVANAKERLYLNLDDILSGRNVFRPLVQEKISKPIDTLLRGGVTFILNLDVLKVRNPIIKINGITIRRSDMLWALTNKEFCYKKIVKVDFCVTHHRQQIKKEELSLNKTIKEIYGSTVFNALKIFYENNKKNSLKEILKEQVNVRVISIENSFKKINKYISVLEQMNDPKLMNFCGFLKVFFSTKNTDYIINKTQQLSEYSDDILMQFKSHQPIIKNYCNLKNTHGIFKQYDLGGDDIKLFSKNPIEHMDKNEPPLVRIHAACCNSEVFGATDCDCASQLNQAFKIINDKDDGIIFYLNQEGRGHGYTKKIAIVNKMQSEEINTYESCQRLGFSHDVRSYEGVAKLLKEFGFKKIKLLSNNPVKTANLMQYGIEAINEQIKCECTRENIDYLISKQNEAYHNNLVITEEKLHEFSRCIEQDDAIYFRNKQLGYFEFSNFSDDPFVLDGKYWRTAEHYYQAQKFHHHPEIYNEIQRTKTPESAKNIADSYANKIDENWHKYKIPLMYTALHAKFSQNDELKETLIHTKRARIVEKSEDDDFWGSGFKGKGKNMLGKIIMYLRDEFSAVQSTNIESTTLSRHDVGKFLQLIEVKKSVVSLDFLNKIIVGTVTHIPYQNLTLLNTKRRPNLNLILSDMLNGIGGLCNVKNSFLYVLLNNLGFDVQFISATISKPDCHVALLVFINDNKYLVDIGNGFPYFQAMDIDNDNVYSHPYMQYKVIKKDGYFHMYHKTSCNWFSSYYFDLNNVLFSSFDDMLDKQYSKKDWGPFLTGIRLNKWTKDGGIAVRGSHCIKITKNFKKTFNLNDFEDFKTLVEEEFSENNFVKMVDIKNAWTEGKSINVDSNIWMFHRVQIEDNEINNFYQQRGMLHTYSQITYLIDDAIEKGLKFGSIAQALENKNIIHLTFDDGYKEHLVVAKNLKQRYNFSWDYITFAINVRNSFYSEKFSMDLIYKSMLLNKLNDVSKIINCDIRNLDISDIKNIIFKSKKYISLFEKLNLDVDDCFLNKDEVEEISKLFSIASHSINHIYLTSLSSDDIRNELEESKLFLQSELNIPIKTICYPEGESNREINKIAKQCGYQYGLSIYSGDGDYEIGRTIPRVSP